MKQPEIVRETINFSPALPSCDKFYPKDEGLSLERGGARFFIVHGLGSIGEDYNSFGQSLAEQGFTVYSPNCNEGLKGTVEPDALSQRIEVIHETIATLDEPIHVTPHSLGAPVTALALGAGTEDGLNEIVKSIASISFMQPAGFEDHGPDDFIHAWKFFMGEAVIRTAKLIPVVLKGGRSSHERFNIRKRAGEVRGLWSLGADYMPSAVNCLRDRGLQMKFLVGPRDDLTRAENIRRVVDSALGEGHVTDIHPNAGHISAVTHPKQTTRVVFKGLGIDYIDFSQQEKAA